MSEVSSIDRLTDSVHYFFKEPGGALLTYIGSVPSPTAGFWYKFTYEDQTGLQTLEVDSDFNIRMSGDQLLDEPYDKVSYYFPPVSASLVLYANSEEELFQGSAKITFSVNQTGELMTTANYDRYKAMLGRRLLGGVNLVVTRSESEVVNVDACVVNEGVIPDF